MGGKRKGPTEQGGAKTKSAKSNPYTSDKRPKQDSASESASDSFKLPQPEPWPHVVEGGTLLDELVAAFQRYLASPGSAVDAMALWVIFTHVFKVASVSPRLAFTSPTPRCGKTTALSILAHLVYRPLPASNITSAVIYRVIERHRPTLLIDEADTFLHEHREMLGILNSGHTRAMAQSWRCHGDEYDPRGYSTWSPAAIAMIGKFPRTLHDRSIEVRMQRRRRDKKLERFRADRVGDLEKLARKAARWASDNVHRLRDADPAIPETLHDRAADNWRLLIAIADLAGETWPDRARAAAVELSGTEEPSDGEQLLQDIHAIFESGGMDRIKSDALYGRLVKLDDRPWREWRGDPSLGTRRLAALLKPFGIRPRVNRIDGKTPRGYSRADFEDAFARYLPQEGATPQQPSEINDLPDEPSATEASHVADREGANPLKDQDCCGVADHGGKADFSLLKRKPEDLS